MEMKETKTLKERVWLTPEQAVVYSGIGRTRLYRYLATGELPSAKLGRTRHIRRIDLDKFLQSRMSATE
jgi:excisionase family DNA binding protein